jgi:broad specificity phosphatase PhoE
MGTLYLVRHGQASFGAADYDQLSELGGKQSERLGQYWRERGLRFDAVLTGTLRRHAQTWAGIAAGAGYDQKVLALEGLNEYDSEAVIATIHPHPLQKPDTPELYRHHFRLLRDGLRQWMNGVVSPARGADFTGVPGAERRSRTIVCWPHRHRRGPRAGPTPETTIELNMRIRNSAVSEFTYTPKRHSLLSYNTLPHLDHPDLADWITYA